MIGSCKTTTFLLIGGPFFGPEHVRETFSGGGGVYHLHMHHLKPNGFRDLGETHFKRFLQVFNGLKPTLANWSKMHKQTNKQTNKTKRKQTKPMRTKQNK